MPKKLIFKNSSGSITTLPSGFRGLLSTNDGFKSQSGSTIEDLSPGSGPLSLTELGFTIVSTPAVINQNVTLPDNSVITYPSPLTIGTGYTLTVPVGTTLTIV